MNRHPEQWIDALLDGELNEEQRFKIAQHLEICRECHDRFVQRRTLSKLLNEMEPASFRLSEDEFIDQIARMLPSRKRELRYSARSKPGFVWELIPTGILFGLVFFHVVNLISNFLILVPGMSERLTVSFPLEDAAWSFSPVLRSTFSAFSGSISLNWDWSTSLIAFLAFSLVYLSWMLTMLYNRQNKTQVIIEREI